MKLFLSGISVAAFLFFVPPARPCNLPFVPGIEQAVRLAQEKKRPVLLFFTGSDWSPRSIALDKNIMENATVEEIILQSYVPVLVDFQQRVKAPADALSANRALAERFNITHFPTIVVLGGDGVETGRLEYKNETADTVARLLSQWAAGRTGRAAK